MPGSYTLNVGEAENNRLTTQAMLLYSGPHFLDKFLTNENMSVLDVACGTGAISAYVAQKTKGKVTGVDLEPARIEANNSTYPKLTNLNFEQADVFKLPFADNTFDLCYCRFLLTHLANPLGAIEEMRRVTKPGGTVVAHELFQDAIWMVPPRPTFQKVFSIWKDKRSALGQNHSLGLQLYGLFAKAKFQSLEVQFLSNTFVGTDPTTKLYLENLKGIIKTLKGGLLAKDLSDQEEDLVNRELETVNSTDLCLEITTVVSGRK